MEGGHVLFFPHLIFAIRLTLSVILEHYYHLWHTCSCLALYNLYNLLLAFCIAKLHNACILFIWGDASLSLVLASPLPHKSHRCPLLLCIKCASFSLQSQVISSTLPRFPTIAPMTSIMMDSMYWELIPFMGPAETYLQCHNGIVTHATSSKVDQSFLRSCPYLPVP